MCVCVSVCVHVSVCVIKLSRDGNIDSVFCTHCCMHSRKIMFVSLLYICCVCVCVCVYLCVPVIHMMLKGYFPTEAPEADQAPA